jgi:calcineurin-like phosphoesterase family protein
VLVFGRTHKPRVHEYGGVLFVNCGAVGKPRDGDPRATFALLASADGVTASIERAAYDALAVARVVGLPDERPKTRGRAWPPVPGLVLPHCPLARDRRGSGTAPRGIGLAAMRDRLRSPSMFD